MTHAGRQWLGEFVPIATGDKIIVWQSEVPFDEKTTYEFVETLGYEVEKPLSCGERGCTLLVTKIVKKDGVKVAPTKDAKRFAMKLGRVDLSELEDAIDAGDKGIGPKVYAGTATGRVLDMDQGYKAKEYAIIMDALDVTLNDLPAAEMAEMNAKITLELVDLAQRCASKKFLHPDLREKNIMLDRKTSRWYLVDFAGTRKQRDKLAATSTSIQEMIFNQWSLVFERVAEKTRLISEPNRKILFREMALKMMRGIK